MRFSIAPGSIDDESSPSRMATNMLELAYKFCKLLSPHVEPTLLFRFIVNVESVRCCVTNEREGQFGLEGGIGKLRDNIIVGLGGRNALGRRNNFRFAPFNFLSDTFPSPTSTFGDPLLFIFCGVVNLLSTYC